MLGTNRAKARTSGEKHVVAVRAWSLVPGVVLGWQLPVQGQLLVRTVLVPAAQLPQPDQLGPWLEQTWTQVDAWVAGHTDHS